MRERVISWVISEAADSHREAADIVWRRLFFRRSRRGGALPEREKVSSNLSLVYHEKQ